MVEPLESTQRGTALRLEMVDVRTLAVTAVHAALMPGRHVREGGEEVAAEPVPAGSLRLAALSVPDSLREAVEAGGHLVDPRGR
ncbi:predicted protein [Streptomyces filamentosus NRRL 15998]|uniref:Predicted protein n=1 Tax=Streptomyces filamentosus NRRL 15998 TaxID=457431 RepID=D6ADC4_STRFL|nr:predicted protein [Streptomyces filamentosus NRRL 15998]